MKSQIITLLAGGALLIGAASCSESWNPVPTTEQGTLDLSSISAQVDTSAKEVQSRADEYNVDEFLVTITPLAGGETIEYTYGSMPEVVTLEVGSYRLDVESHKIQRAEWARPYFCGSAEFEIKNNEITRIGNVECTFQSLKVSVYFTDELRAVMGNDVTVTVVANDLGKLVFTPEETRAGYFEVVDRSMTMVATFEGTVSGQAVSDVLTFTDVEKGQHYLITYKLKNGPDIPEQSGGLNPGGIGVDSSVDEVDIDGNVDPGSEDTLDPSDRPGGKEDPENPPVGPEEPTDPAAEFNSDNIDLDNVNDPADYDGSPESAVVTIDCPKGFKNLIVVIDSDGLTPEELDGIGLTQTFDLVNPGQYSDALAGLGFPVGSDVLGQTSVKFDISTFVPLLTSFPGKSNFNITAIDSEGNSSEQILKFYAN